jgi:uncharacterized protein YbjT (DUF2867 family)
MRIGRKRSRAPSTAAGTISIPSARRWRAYSTTRIAFLLPIAIALARPFGGGKSSPISAIDVARVLAVILNDPAPHIGQIYDLTGPESADMDHYARVFSEALGRPIRYRDVPLPAWSEGLRQARLPEHLVRHLSAMAELTKQGRYDRMTDTMHKLTGDAPMNML